MPQVGAIRVNISVPKQLKVRMEACPEQVNWSKVACQAFEAKLLELESKKDVKGMDDVITRLKAADELDRKAEYQAGRKAGERWAREEARPGQLRALFGFQLHGGVKLILEEFGRTPSLEEFKHPLYSNGISVSLYQAINPHEADPQSVQPFWASVLGEKPEMARRIENQDFVNGFCDGALDVWAKVRGKL